MEPSSRFFVPLTHYDKNENVKYWVRFHVFHANVLKVMKSKRCGDKYCILSTNSFTLLSRHNYYDLQFLKTSKTLLITTN